MLKTTQMRQTGLVMYGTVFISIVLCVLVERTLAESCITPNGEKGACINVTSCSSLLWSFTNPKKDSVAYLSKFVCEDKQNSSLMVCCPVADDILIFENNVDETNVTKNDTVKLTNLKHCGSQRKKEYSSNEGMISVDEFPWLVGIMTIDSNLSEEDAVSELACTGSLINDRYVLSGAYCLIDYDGPTTLFFVRVEEFYARNSSNCSLLSPYYKWDCGKYDDYEIEEKIIHQFYNHQTRLNNIALLRLNRFVPFTGYVRPICLPLPGFQMAKPGEILYISGWSDESDDLWSIKNKVAAVLISNRVCKNIFKSRNETVSITPYEMCSIKSKTATQITCDDYDGNPLLFSRHNRWHIEGISSWGANCTNKQPAVYTRVVNYLQWIQENIEDERCTTPHGEAGECKYLKDCPPLLRAFTNPRKEDEDYLTEFICSPKVEYVYFQSYATIVCCGTSVNFTLHDNKSSPNAVIENNISDLDNLGYCGYQHKDDYFSPSETITVDEFPWLAAIYLSNPEEKGRIVCVGTLISHQYILTGARCLTMFNITDTATVRLGEFNAKSDTDCIDLPQFGSTDCSVLEEYEVEEEIFHPFYDYFTYINDLAVLRLKQTVIFTDYIRPICLPSPNVTYAKPGDTLYTTGWGYNSNYDEVEIDIKKKILTTLISNEQCLKDLQTIYGTAFAVTPHQLCTSDLRNGTEFLCDGDVGGPIMISYMHQWYLVGISSNIACKIDEPQVHTRVSNYLEWIHGNILP